MSVSDLATGWERCRHQDCSCPVLSLDQICVFLLEDCMIFDVDGPVHYLGGPTVCGSGGRGARVDKSLRAEKCL